MKTFNIRRVVAVLFAIVSLIIFIKFFRYQYLGEMGAGEYKSSIVRDRITGEIKLITPLGVNETEMRL
jgi:hypothetical protein